MGPQLVINQCGIDSVCRWWVSFLAMCSVWCGFLSRSKTYLGLNVNPLPPHFLISLSLYLGWVCFICFLFLINLKRDIMGLWKEFFWVCYREFVGFVYKGVFWVCEKCLDLRIDIKRLVGCQIWIFFFFFFGEIEKFVWLPRKWTIKYYFLLTFNEF